MDRVTLKYTSSIRIELIFHCAFPIIFQVAPTNTTIQTTTAPHCPPGWLLCAYSRSQICIKYTWLCDGFPNCPDRWDEKPENCLSRCFEKIYVSVGSLTTRVSNSNIYKVLIGRSRSQRDWVAKGAAQRGRTEGTVQPARRSAPEHDQCLSSVHSTTARWNRLGVDFEKGGKAEFPEKSPWSKI